MKENRHVRILFFASVFLVGCVGNANITDDNNGSTVCIDCDASTRVDSALDDIGFSSADLVEDLVPPDQGVPCTDCGAELLVEHCGVCHGADGTGAPLFPGDISGFDDIGPSVRDGLEDMAAIPEVTTDQIRQMQEFLDGRANADESQWTPDEAFARKCAGCHGADGEGFSRGYWLQQPIDGYFEYFTRNGADRPEYARTMPAYSESDLTNAQLQGIVAKLRGYPIDRSGSGLWDAYCANCHGDTGAGGSSPADIRNLDGVMFLNNTRSGHRGQVFENPGYMPGYPEAFLTPGEVDAMFNYYVGF